MEHDLFKPRVFATDNWNIGCSDEEILMIDRWHLCIFENIS